MKIFSPILKGTTTVSQGTTNLSGSFTGSLLGTAATASYADNFTVGGTLTAQTINVQIITSSIEFVTGSTRNGSTTANTHQFTGSVLMSGSLTVGGAINLDSSAVFPTVGLLNRTSDTTLYLKAATSGFALLDNSKNTMYSSTTTSHIWGINNSEKMRINSSGSVGIGVIPSGMTAVSGIELVQGSQISSRTLTNVPQLYLSSNIAGDPFEATYKVSGYATQYRIQGYDGTHTWYTAPIGTAGNSITLTERMRITPTGNVGIGTSSPSGGISGNELALHLAHSNVSILALQSTAVSGKKWQIYSSNDGSLYFRDGTAGTQVFNLQTSGNVLIGTTTSGVLASANGITLNAGGMIYINSDNTSIFNRSTNSSGTIMQFRYNEAVVVGTISITSTTTAYNTSSDYRLKEDLKSINGLEKVSAINVYDYKWKSSDDRMDGVIAHELQEVLPYAVTGEKDGEDMQGVDYSKIVPVMLKAIQELSAKNTLLEERLTALENN